MSACQGYGQANQITVCVHDAKAYALRGIEAAEDSSATNLGCSNLREKQKEAIISFVSGKDVLVQLQPATESLFATLCCHGYRAYFTFLRRDSTSLPTPVLPTHVLPTKGLDVSFRLQKFSRLHFESLTLC